MELLRPGSMPSAALLVVCRSVPSETSCDLSVNSLAFSRAEKKEIKEWVHSEERQLRALGERAPLVAAANLHYPAGSGAGPVEALLTAGPGGRWEGGWHCMAQVTKSREVTQKAHSRKKAGLGFETGFSDCKREA